MQENDADTTHQIKPTTFVPERRWLRGAGPILNGEVRPDLAQQKQELPG